MSLGSIISYIRPKAMVWLVLFLMSPANYVVAESAAISCSGKAGATPGDYEYKIQSHGYKRSYRVHVPPGYSPNIPTPVVLVFHGGWGSGEYIQKQTKMNAVSDRHGFIAVFPNGKHRAWNAGGCCEMPMRKEIDDVGFVRDLIDKLERDYCVDSRRVYATGFSNGAMLSHRLACDLSDRIAAIAPVSGVIMVTDCKPQRPMPVMVFHGTEDPRSLWEGGLGDKDPGKGVRDSIAVTMQKLTTRYHCSDRVQNSFRKGDVSCETYVDCDGGDVTLCAIKGGGHQWPGGEGVWESKLGPVNRDISASEMMWDFFSKHRKPEAAIPPEQQIAPQ